MCGYYKHGNLKIKVTDLLTQPNCLFRSITFHSQFIEVTCKDSVCKSEVFMLLDQSKIGMQKCVHL